mmetsp:Transcript_17341/g.38374  ORF Transcript_17341/g.38374 Transcript_17341/m.38374 type:complete len:726 (+) Transcript_17341:129-2306(+)
MSSLAGTADSTRERDSEQHAANANPPPPTSLSGAYDIYEAGGNAEGCLESAQPLWNEKQEKKNKKGKKKAPTAADISRQHNSAVLRHLARIQRGRARQRSSEDEKTGDKPTENDAVEDTRMLTERLASISKRSALKAQNEVDKVKNEINTVISMYNTALSQYATCDYRKAIRTMLDSDLDGIARIKLDEGRIQLIEMKGAANIDERQHLALTVAYLDICARLVFLLMDCQLRIGEGSGTGVPDMEATNGESFSIEEKVRWLEASVLNVTKNPSELLKEALSHHESLRHDEVKFRLHVYRSRLLFEGTQSETRDLETRAKTARKELKNAMDTYQNKLCVSEEEEKTKEPVRKAKRQGGSRAGSGGFLSKGKSNHDASESTSVDGSLVTSVSDAPWNEGGKIPMSATFEGMPNKPATAQQSQSTQPGNKVKKETPTLQMKHESVLYLKANLEHLRGNTSKSLKLCSEARSAGKKSRGRSDESSKDLLPDVPRDVAEDEMAMADCYDEAIYFNNLALLHQSAGKVHLALHYYSIALSNMERSNDDASFWSNGLVKPSLSPEILNNMAVCALLARDFKKSYEFLARCIKLSPEVFGRARSFLRLGQSCIGMYTEFLQENKTLDNSRPSGIGFKLEDLGSEEDMEHLEKYPLVKAQLLLENALEMCTESKHGDADRECYDAARVALTYVKLQLKDAKGALELCKGSQSGSFVSPYNHLERIYREAATNLA